jgi:hypothetical protein
MEKAPFYDSESAELDFAAVFWLLFWVSLSLNEHYSWVHAAWVYAALLFAIVAPVFSVTEMFRHNDGSGEYVYNRGVPPRWMVCPR